MKATRYIIIKRNNWSERKVRKAAVWSPSRRDVKEPKKGVHAALFVLVSYRMGISTFKPKAASIQLSELDGVHVFNARIRNNDDRRTAGLHVDALNVHSCVLGLGVSLGLIVLAHAILETLAG